METQQSQDKKLRDTAETMMNRTLGTDNKRSPAGSRLLTGDDGYASKLETKFSQIGADNLSFGRDNIGFRAPVEVSNLVSFRQTEQFSRPREVRYISSNSRSLSPPQVPVITVSPPSIHEFNPNPKLGTPISTTVSVLPPISTLPAHSVQTHSVQMAYKTIPRPTQVVIEQSRSCDLQEIHRLKAENEFLTENYGLVYNRLKELEYERTGEAKPRMEDVACLDERQALREITDRIQNVYEQELTAAMANLRSINFNLMTMTTDHFTPIKQQI